MSLQRKLDAARAILALGLDARAAAARAGTSVAMARRAAAACRGRARGEWETALADKRTENSGASKQARRRYDAFWQAFDAVYLSPQRATASACYDFALEWARREGVCAPPKSAVYRHVERYDAARLALARHGEAALDATYPVQRRHVAGLAAAQEVNADGWPLDTFVQLPPLADGTARGAGRPALWAAQDVASRKILHWRLVEAESAEAVLGCVAGIALAHGVAIENLRLDNTRAASARWLSRAALRGRAGAAALDGVLDEAGVRVRRTRLIATGGKTASGRAAHVGWGGGKPIERTFRVLADRVSRHPALAEFATGRGTGDKPYNYNHGRAGAEWTLVERVLDAEIARLNARRGRAAEGLRATGESADEAWERLMRERPARVASDEYLFALLSPAESAQVRGDGSFALRAGAGTGFGANRYYSPDLLPFAGERVQVRYNPAALHDDVFVTRNGKRICAAKCLHAQGFDCAEAAARHNRERRAYVRGVKQARAAEERVLAERRAAVAAANLPEEAAAAPIVRLATGTDGAPADFYAGEKRRAENKKRAARAAAAMAREEDPWKQF